MSSPRPISIKEPRLPLFDCLEGPGEVIHWTLINNSCLGRRSKCMINKAYDRKVMDDALANKQCHLLFSLSQLIFFSIIMLFHLEMCHITKLKQVLNGVYWQISKTVYTTF